MQFVGGITVLTRNSPLSVKLQYTFTLCNTRTVQEQHHLCFSSGFKPEPLLVSFLRSMDKADSQPPQRAPLDSRGVFAWSWSFLGLDNLHKTFAISYRSDSGHRIQDVRSFLRFLWSFLCLRSNRVFLSLRFLLLPSNSFSQHSVGFL